VSPSTNAWQRAFYLPLTILAWLAVVVVVGWLLGHVATTLLLLALSGSLAFALAPLIRVLSRRLPRPVAIGVAYAAGAAVVLGAGTFVALTAVNQILVLVADLPSYVQQLQGLEPAAVQLLGPFGVTPAVFQAAEHQVLADLQATGSQLAGQVLLLLPRAVETVVDVIVVLMLSVYMAANGARIARWLREETPQGQRRHAVFLVAVVRRVIGGYIRGMFTLAALIGFLVGVGMAVLQVPYAMLLGMLAFFMEFVPVIGVLISGAAAVLVALLIAGWGKALLVLGYFVLVHVIEGDLVGPRIIGPAVGIHPAIGLLALLVGTELFGAWGALFAAPVAGLLQAIVTAAWLELQGGTPQAVLRAVVEHEDEQRESRREASG